MGCFKASIQEVHSLELFVTMSTLKRGLHGGNFYISLFKKFFQSLSELLVHIEQYINVEEGMVKK